MARFAAPAVPEGHVARGTSGVAVNVGAQTMSAYRRELARQRRLWNEFLALQIDQYAVTGEFVFYADMARRLTALRRSDNWIGAGGCAAQQATLRALERALKDSFPSATNRKRFPRFRKAADRRDRMTVPAASLRMVRNSAGAVTHIGFPNLPLLRVRNLAVPAGARVTNAAIAEDGGKLRVSLGLVAPVAPAPTPIADRVGIDAGLTHLATLSTGDRIENPRFLQKALKRLKRAGRVLSRRRKGSANRRRAATRVRRLHRRVANLRRAHHHRQSRAIVDRYAAMDLEALRIKALMRTRMARSMADAGIADFLAMIRYKSRWASRTLYEHPMFERSTGCCPDCGAVGERLSLSVRQWTCQRCATRHDRDVAAARWIALKGTQRNGIMNEVGRQTPEPASAIRAPKRGLAGGRKPGAQAPCAVAGSPANIPHEHGDRLRA